MASTFCLYETVSQLWVRKTLCDFNISAKCLSLGRFLFLAKVVRRRQLQLQPPGFVNVTQW